MTYFTSDQHFGHGNIIKYCSRPFKTVEEMDEVMLAKWNSRVTDEDDVWILGDLFFRSAAVVPVLEQLKGRKHLILGNHDPSWCGKIELEKHFASVGEIYNGTIDGHRVTMCHYPMLTWDGDKNSYMIYGHIHNHTTADYWPLIAKRVHMLNAGVEVNGYMPVTFGELIANNRTFRGDYVSR